MRPADLSGDLFPPEIPVSGNPRFEAARRYAEQLARATAPATKKMLQRQVVDAMKAAIGAGVKKP